MIAFEDLIDPISEEQFLEQFLDILETVGLKARSWRPGGVYRTILRVLAITCAVFSAQQVKFIRSAFLELAEGNWLTWVAFFVYGVARPASTFATGQVTLTNLGGSIYDFTPTQIRIFNTTTKKAYTNQGAVHLDPLGTVTFDVIAIEIGSASSSSAAAIDGVETQYDGQLTVTNALPVIGSDEMPDADLRQLCKDKLGARSVFGPRGAYSYAIRSAKRLDGSTVDVNRASISPFSSTGVVTIYIASPSGVPTTDDVTAVTANVEQIARPDTVTVNISPVTGHAITRGLTIWAKKETGLSADDIKALAEKQLVLLNRSYPIGGIRKGTTQGYFWADNLDGAVQKAHASIYSVDGVGADVALTLGEVPVLAVTVDQVRIIDAEVH